MRPADDFPSPATNFAKFLGNLERVAPHTLEGSIMVRVLIGKLKVLTRDQDYASTGQETSIDGGRSKVGRDRR